jgi:hypothetical protein
MAVNACELTRELEELIAALDRRVPRVEHPSNCARCSGAADESVRPPGGARPPIPRSGRGGQRRSDLDITCRDAKNSVPGESM